MAPRLRSSPDRAAPTRQPRIGTLRWPSPALSRHSIPQCWGMSSRPRSSRVPHEPIPASQRYGNQTGPTKVRKPTAAVTMRMVKDPALGSCSDLAPITAESAQQPRPTADLAPRRLTGRARLERSEQLWYPWVARSLAPPPGVGNHLFLISAMQLHAGTLAAHRRPGPNGQVRLPVHRRPQEGLDQTQRWILTTR